MREQAMVEAIRRILVSLDPGLDCADGVLPEHRLREDLELDSLDLVNLQLAIEEGLSMRFNPIEMDLTHVFETVGSLASFLEEYFEHHGIDTYA